MASKKINARKVKLPTFDEYVQGLPLVDDDSSLSVEEARDEGFKDGMHSASLIVDEVLQAVRVDTENADLDPIAETAAKMTIEAISRLWYERKGVV